MIPTVDTADPRAVATEVQGIYLELYPAGDPTFVSRAFSWATNFFQGRYSDFQPIELKYHNFEHTLQVTLCMMHLLRGRAHAAATPPLPQRMFELGLLAILFHDIGYLKKRGDSTGTGAKYTLVHVLRSAEFAAQLLGEHQYPEADITAVRNMINCTGVNLAVETIRFQNDLERLVGFALGTGDLLGQIAAPDYVEKLPLLFEEFAESDRFNQPRRPAIGTFSTAEEMIRLTPQFWTAYVLPKLTHEFAGLYHFLNTPYPDGPNPYLLAAEANIARIQQQLAAAATTPA